jgi:hypothetical protein
VPGWQPLFWDLAERTTQELLNAVGEWMQALAVVRAEREDVASFRAVFSAVLQRLEGLREQDPVRWHALVGFVLSWALRRRPGRERSELWAAARDSQAEMAHREEMRTMSETIEQTWEQEMIAEGKLSGLREALQELLAEKFGPLPDSVIRRIEQTRDPERLRRCIRQVSHIEELAEVDL